MKKLLLIFPALLFISNQSGAIFVNGRIIEITKDTPVFNQASQKSQQIAIAPQGTLLILEAISPRQLWIQVKDVDNNTGWIPKNRSDLILYRVVKEESTLSKENLKTGKLKIEREKEEQGDKEETFNPLLISQKRHIISPMARIAFSEDNVAEQSYGLSYALISQEVFNPRNRKYEKVGILVGALSSSEGLQNLLFPVRFFMEFQNSSSILFSRVDGGVLWELAQNGSHFLSFSAGYALGLRFGKDLALSLRPGLELFTKTRFSLEMSLSLYL